MKDSLTSQESFSESVPIESRKAVGGRENATMKDLTPRAFQSVK